MKFNTLCKKKYRLFLKPHIKKSHHKGTPEVYILRDWKEYLGESFLIIFSVILALVLTEYFSNLHEKK